ncbi:hypothetical protein Lfu02_04020 [Longispora fulva]|nr:hypothetical protein Lfu02_04020 [Longispora fulva]
MAGAAVGAGALAVGPGEADSDAGPVERAAASGGVDPAVANRTAATVTTAAPAPPNPIHHARAGRRRCRPGRPSVPLIRPPPTMINSGSIP